MPEAKAPEALLVLTDAGGGHRAAARALVAAAEARAAPLRLTPVRIQDVLASLDVLRRLGGHTIEDAYNLLMRRHWTALFPPLLRVLHLGLRVRHRALVRELAGHLARRERPAAVVSLMPNLNAVMRDAVRAALPGVPFLVVLTDYADYPPHFWMEPGYDAVVVGSDAAVAQARALGYDAARIRRVSGMMLHPRFYPRADAAARARARAAFELPADAFVILLLFGGKGSSEMRPLAEALLREAASWTVIAICGDNPPLYASLGTLAEASRGRLRRVGFTDRVADFLAASDLLATKPGPGSLTEAWHQGVPVIVTCNVSTIPQERFNARLVEEKGLGVVVRSSAEIAAVAAALARDSGWLARLRGAVAALPENRAVFEVLAIVEEMSGATPAPSG
jgi:UDP-N-acetylglucosamine:LPS N-acetylglucosamine transferase